MRTTQAVGTVMVVAVVRGCVFAGALLVAAPFLAELGLQASQVVAAEEKKKRRTPTMSEAAFKKLGEAQELIDAKELDTAEGILLDMIGRTRRYNGNELGNAYYTLAYVYYLKEQFPKAIESYVKVLEQGEDISIGTEVNTLLTVAKLCFVESRFQESLEYMRRWIEVAENPGPDARIFLGQVYYQMKDYPNALIEIEAAIDMAEERGMEPKENWYQLLAFLYYDKEDWDSYVGVMQIMVEKFPKREYWNQLAGVFGQIGKEREQLNTMQASYVGDYFEREGDYLTLAGLLMQRTIPYKAAKVLEDGFSEGAIERTAKNLRSLGQAWQLAQEVDLAIPVYEEAGKLAEDGDIFERLAYLYLESDQYAKCIAAIDNALEKGGLRKRQSSYIVRGMCQYNSNALPSARGSFVACRNEARRAEDTSNQRVCSQWITFIDNESERQRQLAAAER